MYAYIGQYEWTYWQLLNKWFYEFGIGRVQTTLKLNVDRVMFYAYTTQMVYEMSLEHRKLMVYKPVRDTKYTWTSCLLPRGRLFQVQTFLEDPHHVAGNQNGRSDTITEPSKCVKHKDLPKRANCRMLNPDRKSFTYTSKNRSKLDISVTFYKKTVDRSKRGTWEDGDPVPFKNKPQCPFPFIPALQSVVYQRGKKKKNVVVCVRDNLVNVHDVAANTWTELPQRLQAHAKLMVTVCANEKYIYVVNDTSHSNMQSTF